MFYDVSVTSILEDKNKTITCTMIEEGISKSLNNWETQRIYRARALSFFKTLNSLFCSMHPLDSISTKVKKYLKTNKSTTKI